MVASGQNIVTLSKRESTMNDNKSMYSESAEQENMSEESEEDSQG